MLKGLVIIQERKVATFIAYVATLMALYYSTFRSRDTILAILQKMGVIENGCGHEIKNWWQGQICLKWSKISDNSDKTLVTESANVPH